MWYNNEVRGRGGMADTLDLGSNAARCAGSSPVARTKKLTFRRALYAAEG